MRRGHLLSILFSRTSEPKGASFSFWIGTPTFYTKVMPIEVYYKMTTEQSQHNVHSLIEFMCKTESFRAGKEHCIIQTALHAAMLSSKTAVVVCAVRFSCPPVEGVGCMSPLSPWWRRPWVWWWWWWWWWWFSECSTESHDLDYKFDPGEHYSNIVVDCLSDSYYRHYHCQYHHHNIAYIQHLWPFWSWTAHIGLVSRVFSKTHKHTSHTLCDVNSWSSYAWQNWRIHLHHRHGITNDPRTSAILA